MKNGGVGLDGETKNRLIEIEFWLSEISMFISKIIDSAKAFNLDIVNSEDVQNVQFSATAFLLSLSLPQTMKLWHILITAPGNLQWMAHHLRRQYLKFPIVK